MPIIKLTGEDEAEGLVVVFDLLKRTGCLAEVKGADMATLAHAIAVAIARARTLAEAAAAPVIDGPPLPKYHDLLDILCERFGITGSPSFNEALDRIDEHYDRKAR